jgi:hypothetical protein
MQGFPVTFEIFHVVGMIVDLPFLEKAVELSSNDGGCRSTQEVGCKGLENRNSYSSGHYLHWVRRTENWRRSFLDANQTERRRHRTMVHKVSAMVTK